MAIDKRLKAVSTELIVGCFFHAIIKAEGKNFNGEFEIKTNNELAKLLYKITREDFDKKIIEKANTLIKERDSKLASKKYPNAEVENNFKTNFGKLSKIDEIYRDFYDNINMHKTFAPYNMHIMPIQKEQFNTRKGKYDKKLLGYIIVSKDTSSVTFLGKGSLRSDEPPIYTIDDKKKIDSIIGKKEIQNNKDLGSSEQPTATKA